MNELFKPSKTKCWTCANATGGCSWSEHEVHQPVPGWIAEATRIKMYDNLFMESYIVHYCPQYVQDSLEDGLKRIPKEQRSSHDN